MFLKHHRCGYVEMSNINAHILFCKCIYNCRLHKCLFIVYLHSSMSFGNLCVLRTLGYVKWRTESIASSQTSLVLLGTIMVVMKAHLSPSELHLILHNLIAVALEWKCSYVSGEACVFTWKRMFEMQSCIPTGVHDVKYMLELWHLLLTLELRDNKVNRWQTQGETIISVK